MHAKLNSTSPLLDALLTRRAEALALLKAEVPTLTWRLSCTFTTFVSFNAYTPDGLRVNARVYDEPRQLAHGMGRVQLELMGV